jgi:hypothetical protein
LLATRQGEITKLQRMLTDQRHELNFVVLHEKSACGSKSIAKQERNRNGRFGK